MKCTAVCWQLDSLCGSLRGSAGSGVLNCMYCCVLVVGPFVWECEGSAGSGVLNFIYCCVLVVGHVVWKCERIIREWRTELYVLLCVGSWTCCVEV